MLFIVLAILAFGVIIAIHELGHYLSARALNVKVNEFAIGMGPKLLKYQGKETLYSLRAIPFGGFCSMEGEHEEGEEPDPRSFLSQKPWRRIIILVSGSFANFIAAFIIVLILTAGADSFGGTTITNVVDRFPEQGPSEIMAGDRFVAMNGERLFYHDDFVMFSQLNAGKPLVVTIERNGELIEYQRRTYLIDGAPEFRYIPTFNRIDANFWETIKYSGYQTYSFIRMIRLSIAMMVSGAIGIGDFAGPVGIIDTMNTIGHQVQANESTSAAIGSIVFFTAFIGVNVAVINLLPIPAMDGGRIFFTVLTWIIEKISKKRLDPKYEGYINTGAFVLLIGLMIFILYNDIARIVTR